MLVLGKGKTRNLCLRGIGFLKTESLETVFAKTGFWELRKPRFWKIWNRDLRGNRGLRKRGLVFARDQILRKAEI
jgi:hypothetical protein